MAAAASGLFNSCRDDFSDGGSRVCGEGFAGWFWFTAFSSDEGEGAIADMGEGGGRVSGADAAGVLGEGAILDAEEAVFDLPVGAGDLEEPAGIGGLFRQVGDGVDDLALAVGFEFAAALDPADAQEPRPCVVEAGRQGAHGDAAGLDAAMLLADRLRPFQVRRIALPVGDARQRGDP
ncbi:MAG: hypothetical protein JWL84_1399 [Rhodospirillales bacterium]|nr:hypothetical protein [Rhodospirillales bacterium]